MMHSCEVVLAPPPPVQGAALLLELGTLIIEGRSGSSSCAKTRSPERRYVKKTNSNNGSGDQNEATISTNIGIDNTTTTTGGNDDIMAKTQDKITDDVKRGATPKNGDAEGVVGGGIWPTPMENSEDGLRGIEDVHRRVLANKLLTVRNYQKLQFGKEDEGDKMALTSTTRSPPSPGPDQQVTPKTRLSALKGQAEALWREQVPLCIEVLLAPDCNRQCVGPLLLLERWTMSVYCKRDEVIDSLAPCALSAASPEPDHSSSFFQKELIPYSAQDPSYHITSQWLLNAVRSQLHFSQISAWNAKLRDEQTTKAKREQSPSERQRKLSRETCNFKKYESNCDEEELLDQEGKDDGKKNLNIVYNLKIPVDNFRIVDFKFEPVKHTFPITDIGSNVFLKVTLESLPRVEDIPTVRCNCFSSNPGTLKRRRSKDLMNAGLSEEVLANTLASACTLAEVSEACCRIGYQDVDFKKMESMEDVKFRMKGATFSPDLGIINPDKGCSSGISRKFSAYSSPNSSNAIYRAPNSRGSTPDRSDLNDSGFSCTTANCEGPLHRAGKRKSKFPDSSYQFVYDETNIQVPSDNIVKANYIHVDDRMQTPCRQKGKHRCNCDEESDQGSKETKNQTRKDFLNGNESKTDESSRALNERQKKELAKYLRRLRKETKLKMRESGQSSQENSECKSEETTTQVERDKASRKGVSKGRHNDLIPFKGPSMTGVDDGGGCLPPGQQPEGRRSPVPEAHACKSEEANSILKVPKTVGNSKTSDPHPATSIPILQASRFDHMMRFGNYRNSVSLHGALSSRDAYSSKEPECVCSSIGCDQMASVKTCNNQYDNNRQQTTDNSYHIGTKRYQNQSCQTTAATTTCHQTRDDGSVTDSDDNYTPKVKKMISSYTQTDDFMCDCGKPLIPKCFECSDDSQSREPDDSSGLCQTGMKRSRGSHDLASINKSALFLEAIERTSRLSECKEDTDTAIDAIVLCDNEETDLTAGVGDSSKIEVIENICDNSFSNFLCDKNIYLKCKNFSCKNDLLARSASLFSGRFVKDSNTQPNVNGNDDLKPITNEKTRKTALAENIDRAIDFIRKPKLKRLMPIVDKLDKVVMERNEERKKELSKNATTSPAIPAPSKNIIERTANIVDNYGYDQDEDYLYKDEESGITYMRSYGRPRQDFDKSHTCDDFQRSDSNRKNASNNGEKHIVVYEKGEYGNIVQNPHGEKHSFEDNEDDTVNYKHFRRDDNIFGPIDETSGKIVEIHSPKGCRDRIMKNSTTYGSFDHSAVPSVSEMDKFRWRLDSAASMVFHSRTGLPLTSSPAPLRRGKSCFDYDSSINSVSSIKSALYGVSVPDLEPEPCGFSWSPGSSPGSPLHWGPSSPPLQALEIPRPTSVATGQCENTNSVAAFSFPPTDVPSATVVSMTKVASKRSKFRHGTSSGLLGSFEESVLNGRLEPTATVAGFTAEIGASGAFCPAHLKLPVTVFFYSLGENTTSAPYLGHINLGRRGYNVPRAGTIQATLFNPHGTVVKMFVVMYDMADMPANSRTFLRQRTLCMPAVETATPDPRALRYLIHLRFLTSKSGKVYLHTDIRIIVSRKADLDTAHSLNSAMAMQDGRFLSPINSTEGRKKKMVETGTFEKRTNKNKEEVIPRVNRIFGGGNNLNIIRKKMNRSEGCFELASYCVTQNKSNENGKENSDSEELPFDISVSPPLQNGSGHSKLDSDRRNQQNCGNFNEEDRAEIRRRSGSTSSVSKELSYELRSFTYGPDNPKYSPR